MHTLPVHVVRHAADHDGTSWWLVLILLVAALAALALLGDLYRVGASSS